MTKSSSKLNGMYVIEYYWIIYDDYFTIIKFFQFLLFCAYVVAICPRTFRSMLSMNNPLSLEMFEFLKQWYNEENNKKSNDFKFEKYLASFIDNEVAVHCIENMNANINCNMGTKYPIILAVFKRGGIEWSQFTCDNINWYASKRRNLSVYDYRGWDMLHLAVRYGRSPMAVQWLIKNDNFDVNDPASIHKQEKWPNLWDLLVLRTVYLRNRYDNYTLEKQEIQLGQILIAAGIKINDKIIGEKMNEQERHVHLMLMQKCASGNINILVRN